MLLRTSVSSNLCIGVRTITSPSIPLRTISFLPSKPQFRSSLRLPLSTPLRQFTSSAPPNADKLNWDEFLRLRRQRRLTGVLAGIPSAVLGVYGGWYSRKHPSKAPLTTKAEEFIPV